MTLLLTIISLALYFLSPADVFPELAPYHLQKYVLIPAMAASLFVAVSNPALLRAKQHFLVLGFWGAIFASFASQLLLRGALSSVIDFGVTVCLYFLVAINASTLRRIRVLYSALALCALIMAIRAIAAYHFGYMETILLYRTIIEEVVTSKRAMGTGVLSDPNDFSQFLCIGIALLGIRWKSTNGLVNVLFVILPIPVLLWAIYLTESRGAIFGLVAIAASLALKRVGKVGVGILAVVLVVLFLAVGFGGGREISTTEGSAAGRVMAWGLGFKLLVYHPIFGVGFNMFQEYNDLTAHNSFVLCFAELGLFGYFMWIALVVLTFTALQTLAAIPDLGEDFQRHITVTRSAFFAYLLTSWFLSRTYVITVYVFIAVTVNLVRLASIEKPELVDRFRAQPWVLQTCAAMVGTMVVLYGIVRIRTL